VPWFRDLPEISIEYLLNVNASIKIRVQPKASRNEILGFREDTLRVRVTAPPEGGKANDAVVSLLAQALGLARSRVSIARGHAARDKLVVIADMDPAELRRRLGTPGG
jgi:hypothetical protein